MNKLLILLILTLLTTACAPGLYSMAAMSVRSRHTSHRVGTASASVAKQGARGAAIGIGAAGVFGLMLGIAPPPRVFAGAAVIGAYNGAADAAGAPRLGTIYVASSPATSGGGADLLAARTTTQRFNPRANTSMTPVITSHIPEAGAVGEGMVHAVSPYTTMATSHSRASR